MTDLSYLVITGTLTSMSPITSVGATTSQEQLTTLSRSTEQPVTLPDVTQLSAQQVSTSEEPAVTFNPSTPVLSSIVMTHLFRYKLSQRNPVNSFKSSFAVSVLDCASVCTNTNNCMAANLDLNSKLCHMFDFLVPLNTLLHEGIEWSYIYKY